MALADARLKEGDFSVASAHADLAGVFAERSGEPRHKAIVLALEGRMLLVQGAPADARARLQAALEIFRLVHQPLEEVRALVSLSEAFAAAGAPIEAASTLDAADGLIETMEAPLEARYVAEARKRLSLA